MNADQVLDQLEQASNDAGVSKDAVRVTPDEQPCVNAPLCPLSADHEGQCHR